MFCIILACFEVDVQYNSAPEDEINDQTADLKNTPKDCQELCRKMEKCSMFTWSVETKSCKLLKGAYARVDSKGQISGPPVCQGTTVMLPFS